MEPTEIEKAKIWDDVQKEFPNDEMMQQIHFVRQIYHLQTKDLSTDERIRFWGGTTQKATA